MSRIASPIHIEISPGELIDRITILQIKIRRIADSRKLSHVQAELSSLLAVRERCLAPSRELDELTRCLADVNESLWQIEDELRQCEADQQFGGRFIDLARSVYRNNDRRYGLKCQINRLVGLGPVEEKSHPAYE